LQSIFDASQKASGTPAKTNLSARKTEVQQLYLSHYSTLTAAAYEAYPHLLVMDADRIMELLHAKLSKYTGPSSDEPFLRWATRFVRKESERYAITAQILLEQNRVIHGAINTHTWTSAVDRSVEHDDLYWEIALLIFQRAHSLNRKGTAKLSTRITALVKKHIYLYYNSKNQRRLRLVTEHVQEGGSIDCEMLSPEEIASTQPQALEYDAGYSECGLSA
jgi:hypothetical protein